MRILKGYSKDEQKELEDAKRKYMNGGDLFHIITGFLPDTRCGLIWKKYDKADKDERISIIKDILDFYNGKAKFAGPKKYYVHLIKGDRSSYLNIKQNGALELCSRFEHNGWKTKFTHEEIIAMNPQLLLFEEEVEVDNKANKVQNETYRKQLNYLEDKHMRILEGWPENERKELEEAKDNGFDDAICLINGIVGYDNDCIFLAGRYEDESSDEDNQLAKDIADYYAGVAEFAEPKKYYVHLIKDDRSSYLNITSDGGAELDNNLEFGDWKTNFTRDEVVAIDPRLVPFMEEVDEDDE